MFQSELGGGGWGEFNSQASKKSRPKCYIWKTKMNQLKNARSSCGRGLRKTASRVLPGCTFFFSLFEECLKPHCKRCRTSREGKQLLLLTGSSRMNGSDPSSLEAGGGQDGRWSTCCFCPHHRMATNQSHRLRAVASHSVLESCEHVWMDSPWCTFNLSCVGIHQHFSSILTSKSK